MIKTVNRVANVREKAATYSYRWVEEEEVEVGFELDLLYYNFI